MAKAMDIAKTLFEALGSIGAFFACKALAAILLWLICRPKLENQTYRENFLSESFQ